MTNAVRGPATNSIGDRILKVDHAGEQGAICIYRAQRVVAGLTARSMREQLSEFLIHEKRHRSIFGAALMKRGVRRCRSYWLCSAGGYALGFVTALFGRRAIAATTIAVEATVLRHLAEQRTILLEVDPDAAMIVSSIIEDEQLHHDRSFDHMETDTVLLGILRSIVAKATESVIWLGMKL